MIIDIDAIKRPVNNKFQGINGQLLVIERRPEAMNENVDMILYGVVEMKTRLFAEDIA